MKVLFITLISIDDIKERGIYADLMNCFVQNGHTVNIVSPIERRTKMKTYLKKGDGFNILRVRTLNIQKTNVVEKTLATFLIDYQIRKAIRSHLDLTGTDLILYSTPPITLVHTIQYCKNLTGANTYLLLKDIFPQNAVDMGYMGKKSPLYSYFRKKEKQLYALSDMIGCMSPANAHYVTIHNPEIPSDRIEVCPNAIYPIKHLPTSSEKEQVRKELGISIDKQIFIYGGNLGKPQAVDFIIRFLDSQKNNTKAFFLIIGSGTEYGKMLRWHTKNSPANVYLSEYMPKNEYDNILRAADIGLIFLDYRFSIPNFPSRLLSYLENAIPVVAATDTNTDIGDVIESNGFGYKTESREVEGLNEIISRLNNVQKQDIQMLGQNGRTFLENNYHVSIAYQKIINSIKKVKRETIYN